MFEVKVELSRLGPKQFEQDKITVTTKLDNIGEISPAIQAMKEAILGESDVVVTVKEVAVKETITKSKPPEDIKEEAVVKEEKVKKAKVKVSQKATAYDRLLDTHKKLLAGFLDTNFIGWKAPATLVKAGAASAALVGADFLDGEGEILQSFKDAFLAYLR
jgi:hypothetical protein